MSDEDDTEAAREEEAERIIAKGKCVFSHNWDSGGPGGGAGSERVYRWRGRFAVSSLDFGPAGPFDSFEAALQARSLLTVTSATTGIFCSLLSSAKLGKLLAVEIGVSAVEINDEEWTYDPKKGELRREDDAGGYGRRR